MNVPHNPDICTSLRIDTLHIELSVMLVHPQDPCRWHEIYVNELVPPANASLVMNRIAHHHLGHR